MKIKNRLKASDLRSLIYPLAIIIIILMMAHGFLISSMEKHYLNYIKEDSINLANSYSENLTKCMEAHENKIKLLKKRLLVAGRILSSYDGEFTKELLIKAKDDLMLDEINYYNSQGQIIVSTDSKLLGWQSRVEASQLIDGRQINKIKGLEGEADTNQYYLLDHKKMESGNIIQMGILTERGYKCLKSSAIQNWLEDLNNKVGSSEICFINNDLQVVGSTNKEIINSKIDNKEIAKTILSEDIYSQAQGVGGKKVYDIFVPVYSKGEKVGTLHFSNPLKHAQEFIKRGNMVALIGTSLILLSLLYVILSTNKKNKQLLKLAYYDDLTKLPNHECLAQHFTNLFRKRKRSQDAILFINCVGFEDINLISGYRYGDRVIQKISTRIKSLSLNNTVYRFEGDRFVIIVNNYKDRKELSSLSKKIISNFRENSIVDNKYIEIQISIVEIDDSYENGDQVLKNASIALNYIGDNNYIFFNSRMEEILSRENYIEKELIRALAEEDTEKLHLVYQPQVSLKTNKIIGFEALARMETEKFGFIPPMEFINIAERKHLIIPLGNLILRRACTFIARLNKEGYKNIKIAVNISAIQLLHDDFNKTIVNIIDEVGIKGSNLELEITESIMIGNFKIINKKLKDLRDIGVKIALDDFGTGYSSFASLRELNIDMIKMDKHFIDRISDKEENELITNDIISMSHKIGLDVMAEGVEEEVQKKYLLEHGCDFIQGYLISKSIPEEQALQIIKDNIGDHS